MAEPKVVNGVDQLPMPGVSMRYSFDDANAKDRHITQYTETAGNRSIYHDGWLAAVVHTVLWEPENRTTDFSQDKWELYNMGEDFGLATDLAAQYPEKVEAMKALLRRIVHQLRAAPAWCRAARWSPYSTGWCRHRCC